ncbi:MAG: diacylglycerol kinase family protein [Actinomycetota bacterium]|nr:diacylglycerol kinase family protein [Actinomycetota bacterium]
MRLLLLVNGSASSVTARTRVMIQTALARRHDVELAKTSRRGHASRLARGAAATGTEVVVVLGGDGTLNEAANGLVGTDCALAALPGGSTNVFARTIGTPDDPLAAADAIVEALDQDSIRPVGLGEVGGRYFLFHCGMGFDAAVVEQVERRSALKRYAGHPLFVWAGFTTWFRHYERRTPRMSVRHDGGGVDDSYFTVVLNTDPYTYLGSRPLSLAPEATLDRGLCVIAVRTMSFGPMLGLVGNLIRGSTLADDARIHAATDLEHIEIVGHQPFPYQLDGDHLGDVHRLDFTWHPEAMRLVLPKAE